MRDDHHLVEYYRSIWESNVALARASCSGPFSGAESCDWYHASWPVLRLLDMVSTPYWHRSFYEFALADSVSVTGSVSDVCVLGAADFSMAELTAEALARVGTTGRITVLDRCPSALRLSRDWAAKSGAGLQTRLFDVTKNEIAEDSQDLVLTDALLTRFDTAGQNAVLALIARSLRSRGRFITTVRDHSWTLGAAALTPHQYAEKAASLANEMGLDHALIQPLALEYAMRMHSFPIEGPHEIEARLGDAGLEVIFMEQAVLPGELRRTAYLRLVAQKSGG